MSIKDRFECQGSDMQHLYGIGCADALIGPKVAIAGMRNATEYGMRAARWAAEQFAWRGTAVVCGGARGSESAAIRGALSAHGRVIVVLPGGPDNFYPKFSQALFEKVCERGCIVSTKPFGSEFVPRDFLARNCVIVELCGGVVLCQSKEQSGTEAALRYALEGKKRDVWAIPGSIFDAECALPNQLIEQGLALPICHTTDINAIAQRISTNTPEHSFVIRSLRADAQQKLSDAKAAAQSLNQDLPAAAPKEYAR